MMFAPAAWAATDIDYFYNSGDHDAKARFRSYGEHIDLCKLNKAKVLVEHQNAVRPHASTTMAILNLQGH